MFVATGGVLIVCGEGLEGFGVELNATVLDTRRAFFAGSREGRHMRLAEGVEHGTVETQSKQPTTPFHPGIRSERYRQDR